MKSQITKILTIAVLTTGIIFSCKKKETTPDNSTNATTTGSTTGGGTTGGTTGSNLQANSFTYNGRVFSTTTVQCQKVLNGSIVYRLLALSTDTIYQFDVTLEKYLPSSFNANIGSTSAPTGSIVGLGITKFRNNPYYLAYNTYVSGGSAIITNQGSGLTIDISPTTMSGNTTVAGKIVFTAPIIPSANASYTVPNGYTANQFTIGATTYTSLSANKVIDPETETGFSIAKYLSGTTQLSFTFKNQLPPSGTYAVVNSTVGLAPGQVFVSTGFTKSIGTGSITVVTTQTSVSITAPNITMVNVFPPNTSTSVVNGNFTH
jgi:hypothetical protein